ncbi:MAG: hypothetical protein JWP92_1661 [Caulobacter sp.]|nr:hypothetical protein [Caulobacter sp.]
MPKSPENPRDRWTIALGMLAMILMVSYVAARGLGLLPSPFRG